MMLLFTVVTCCHNTL